MKHLIHFKISIVLATILFSLFGCASTESTTTAQPAPTPVPTPFVVPEPAPGHIPTVFIIGDSTASNYEAKRYPRMGWGQVFSSYVKEGVTVTNAAISGASTRSFVLEGIITRLSYEMKAGDYLLVQFGHNDSKVGDARYAAANGEYIENLVKFAEVARKKGVKTIIMSPIQRRSFDGSGNIVQTHGEYPAASKKAAEKADVYFIDMTLKTTALFERAGPDGTKKLFLHLLTGEYLNYPNGVADDTHLHENGAHEVAKLVIEGIKESEIQLKEFLK